jgi:glycosyltransferase involved in cell wall biosynthesis
MDVAVLPTVLDFEGVPVTVIEALAAARPVVATAVGGVAEIIRDGDTGRLVPPRDDEALARGIKAMLDDPDGASAMGRRGQALAASMFQIDRYLKETDAFFREIVSTRSPQAAAGVASTARS